MADASDTPARQSPTAKLNAQARPLALQVLFAWDATGADEVAVAEHITRPTDTAEHTHEVRQKARDMARGAWNDRKQIDDTLERLSPKWPPRRQPAVDRNILRLAIWELFNTDTPPKAILDEAIELAKEFSTADSGKFVNGVLDAALKERNALLGN
ncbi:MAG: transcription antitermination factor NusB [Planctomycetota bacterium]